MVGLRSIPSIGSLGPKSPAKATPKAPPAQRSSGRPLQIVDPFEPQVAPRGPAHLHLGQKRVTGVQGPGPQPSEWPGSGAEWVWYWASAKYHKDPKDPRTIFTGGATWAFADPIGAGISATRDPGIGTADFEYLAGANVIIVKIEGYYWHYGMGGAQTARDLYLTTHMGGPGDRLVRVNDGEYMFDETGSAAIELLADILAGREKVGAGGGGTLREPRYADFARGVEA
jgi:hypothetical protein